jgi:macrolide transport system ATP-binding/permease protein
LFESLFADIRYALRWLRRSPAFTLVAVTSLAVGIGFNTALFTIADALLFKPLPVSHPESLVDVYTSAPSSRGGPFSTTSLPDYLDLKQSNEVFADVIAYTPMFGALSTDNGARLAMGEAVTGNYFDTLGVPAFIGRMLRPEDDVPGAAPVVAVSYRYWQRELQSTGDLNGKTLRIRGLPYTIVGVTPPTFNGMVPVLSPELFLPVASSLDVEPVGMNDVVPGTGSNRLERRGHRWLFLRARLKPGQTFEQARANVQVVGNRLSAQYPATNKDRQMSARRTNDVHFHPAADPVILPIASGLMAIVAAVLLIACLNVASMLVARASARQREIGVRLAIGASRGRLIRQLVTETLVLATVGAVAGTLLAWWLTTFAASIRLPSPIPLTFNLHIDARVLIFTLLISLAAALVAGVLPAIIASKPNLVAELRGETRAVKVGSWFRYVVGDAIVAMQLAITAILLVVAALLTRSVLAAERANLGIPVERIALISIDASQLRYPKDRIEQFYAEAQERIRRLPGVEAVGLTTRPPFTINQNRWEIWIPSVHQPGQPGVTVDVTSVSAEYFQAVNVPILAGRPFSADDRTDTPRVAIVNETMARRFWPNQSAVGQVFRTRNSNGTPIQIVGVAADHKVSTVGESATPFLHVARTQQWNPYSAIIARTNGNADALLKEMQKQINAVEPTLAFVEHQTMTEEVGMTMFPIRASAWLVTIVGLVAMLLAAVGLYGVIAYSVARRTREIGIRMALGASQSLVVGSVMRKGLALAAIGLAGGSLLAVVAARRIGDALYGIGSGDPASWVAAAAVLLGVSVLANLIPAWRASRVHPSEALRTE